ncbi:ornithine cyclodeaminase [Paramesorhizobium deserti]|uniref:Ornithine cyclodeaminase n=2 Tax=Paramesorhizobium deserti TaxID=1494590 RepID=A0A135I185_9HYPH|nr:ornithine cyclodeaminase [Paramesorhizobium deserti]KXF79193.1 ornithine cyclodeaminase [Paramesorhizobium deserti]
MEGRTHMVQFVGTQNMIDLVGSIGLEDLFRKLVTYIEQDFIRWNQFDKTPRVASHSDNGVIELMPTADHDLYGFKYVNGHPQNPVHGLQTVTAFGVLADVATGYPEFISEMTIATALRTAATSAMAAKYLAREDTKVMALIGLGAQAEFQALAFKAILGIRELRVFDVDPAAYPKFLRNMVGSGIRITEARSAEEAVMGADIITTVTADKRRATILSDNMIGAGVHINAVGGDCPGKTELQRDILLRSDIFVEFPPQTRVEGEIQQLDADYPVTELWQVIAGEKPGRSSPRQITLFDSVGFAVEDFSALRFFRDQVQGTRFYRDIDLIAEPNDPRDLFGLLARTGSAAGQPALTS